MSTTQELPIVTPANVVDVLATLRGTMFVGIDTVTAVKLPGGAKNIHQGRVFKVTTGWRARISQNKFVNGYENAVKKQMLEEGKDPTTFELGPRTWGTRIPETPLIEHEGNYYLEVIVDGTTDSYYLLDNKKVEVDTDESGQKYLKNSKNELLTLLPKVYGSSEEAQGGVEDKVIIRTLKLDSILNLRCNHTCYRDLYYKV